MTQRNELKVGDLVTVDSQSSSNTSNTYQIAYKLDKISVLNHPLAPECFLVRSDESLNNDMPFLQSSVEKCLFFALENKSKLGHTMSADLEALCFYFVIRKSFTTKQRAELAGICGRIASVILTNSINNAASLIKENKVLLDEYTETLYYTIKKVLNNPLNLENKNQKYTIFNIAGFILAQIGSRV